jgi:hypothetical protein
MSWSSDTAGASIGPVGDDPATATAAFDRGPPPGSARPNDPPDSLPIDQRATTEVVRLVVDVELDRLLGHRIAKDQALSALAARQEIEQRMRGQRWLPIETARRAGATWREIDHTPSVTIRDSRNTSTSRPLTDRRRSGWLLRRTKIPESLLGRPCDEPTHCSVGSHLRRPSRVGQSGREAVPPGDAAERGVQAVDSQQARTCGGQPG